MKTLSARAADAASASPLDDEDVRDGFPGRRRDVRIVALGGGTGLPVLLGGLKAALFPAARAGGSARERERLTAIVTAADDGGSSGRLREQYQVLPPGDIRNCLLALADADPALSAIFAYRFGGDGERGVGGHSLGNLPIPDDLIPSHGAEARPIAADREALIALGCRPVERDLLGADPLIRHDASKLARAVVDLALEGAAR